MIPTLLISKCNGLPEDKNLSANSTTPGKIELMRIFLPANSFDKETVTASNAALVAEYTDPVGRGVLPASELMLIILPPFSPNSFMASRIDNTAPVILIFSCCCIVTVDTGSIGW
jgi:hypothetical protein